MVRVSAQAPAGLTEALFAEVNAHLADRGITLRPGTLVDAATIAAPSPTRNKAGRQIAKTGGVMGYVAFRSGRYGKADALIRRSSS